MFYAGLACKHDEPVISGGVKTRVTFLPPEGPALTSYDVMPGVLLGGQVQWLGSARWSQPRQSA